MKKVSFWIITFLVLFCSDFIIAQNIVINEILTSNTTSIEDEDNSHQDWIELYNNGGVSVNLNGFGLSDDPALPFKWKFPNISIDSGKYLIIWASDKNRTVAGSPLHTNYKISSSGETITLTNASGTTIDSMLPVELREDISYGRFPNGSSTFSYFGTPTPNAPNSSPPYSGYLKPPVFSKESGFYTSGFDLSLSSQDSGTKIIYTLDGSEPDENNLNNAITYNYKNKYIDTPGQTDGPMIESSYRTLEYSSNLNINDRSNQPDKVSAISSTFDNDPSYYFPDNPVFKGTIVRAKVIKQGFLSSETVTKNYFVTPLGKNKFTLPIVSLSINEDRFFGYNNGIYVAGFDFDDWRKKNPNGKASESNRGNYYLETNDERIGHMNYFVDGIEKISQDIGLKIRGGSTRKYEKKSLTVYARSEYGDGTLDYKFFEDLPYTSYERLTLSTSGWDFHLTKFRDALVHQLCKGIHVEVEAYQPAITFINGEYWGLTNIRERFDNNYFDRVYKTKNVDLLENHSEEREGDSNHYDAMLNYINTHPLADSANYNYIKTQLDPESFIDFNITEIFFQNNDWPDNNTLFWRNKISNYDPTAPYGLDGRWRWLLHDLDATFSFGTDDFNGNTLNIATSINTTENNPDWSTFLLRKLLENDSFKIDFINRFADLLNTSFLPNRIISKMNEMKQVIEPEMAGELSRWNVPSSMSEWQEYIDKQRDFANARPAFQRDHIRSKFQINKNINVTLNVSDFSQGYIKISTIEINNGTPGISNNPYPWTGVYFHNIPLKLKAIAKPGFVFDHWAGASTSTSDEITITPTDNISITAVFVPSNNEASIPIYFWLMDSNITNGEQLTFKNSTYQLNTVGVIQYQSCNTGYPFPPTDINNYGKASMERRNLPTNLNYRPEANNNIAYSSDMMKGLQIKEPLQKNGLENIMIFNIPTVGYKKIKISFAAINELTNATGITVDYSINTGSPIWITTELADISLPLSNSYQILKSDFSTISTVDNNPNFKIRLRFSGSNMNVDNGNRVTFNNITVDGVKMPFYYSSPNTFTVGNAIASLSPNTSLSLTDFSISPNLPTGLSISSTTGKISGIPTANSQSTIYTVTAKSEGINLSSNLIISVSDIAPKNLSYSSPNIFTKSQSITNLSPTNIGGTPTNFTVTPQLPNGLNLNQTTGVISGTPTQISNQTNYNITASNSGGSDNFNLSITINDIKPSNLSYNSPNVFTKNQAIANLIPNFNGGVPTNFLVTPQLPDGLILNQSTGTISGTPTEISSQKNYTITATNSGGSSNFSISITVNDIKPSDLSYNTPNVFVKNQSITNLSPTVNGGVPTNFSVTPQFPNGLTLNQTTGVISGTPTQISPQTNYTITASNTGGNSNFSISITVNDIKPSDLSYNTPNTFTKNQAITNLLPTYNGGIPTNFSVMPQLPNGLTLNQVTGVISGTPTQISPQTDYTITATNLGGNSNFSISITVNDNKPSDLSYNTPNVFTKNQAITNLSPTINGGITTNFSVTPHLPNGLTLNQITGVISGTPTQISPQTNYIITAINLGGSTNFSISITVNDIKPENLNYNNPNVFIKNQTITDLTPNINGGIPTNFSVTPPLPNGLTLNQNTGVISGTSTQISPQKNYTITAANSGGSDNFNISITVNDIPPTDLTYTSPNIFTKGIVIENLLPTVTGGAVINYSIVPELPIGLNLNNNSGVISGTPTETSEAKTYNITAQNSGGYTSFNILITVQNSLSIMNNDLNKLMIYPNPFSDKIRISDIDQPFHYKLFSIDGKLIKSEFSSSNEIELGELANGVYLIEFSLDEFSVMKKIIKNR